MLGAAALLLSVNPLGYFGGRWDDGRYFEAAWAWAAGPVLGLDHWALRWPVVLPAAGAIRALGVTRDALAVPGLLTLAALLAINFWAARRVWGGGVATLFCLALLTTPELLHAAPRLTADLPELLFWSAALWAFWFGRDGSRGWLLAAGIASGLAWATRETSLGLLLLLALAFVAGRGAPRTGYVWIALGFATVTLPEMLALWSASGDPLYRLHVDLHHIDIPSTNLAGLTAPGATAPLNIALMARWSGDGPLRLHWAIDPWLNLLANPVYGLNFLLAAIGAVWLRRQLRWPVLLVAAIVALNVVTVTYLIATDPKPRMFMPATVAAALLLALVAGLLWQHGHRRVVLAAGVVKLIAALVLLDVATSYAGLPALARAALAVAPGPVHVDRWSASHLVVADPAVRRRLSLVSARPGDLYLTIGKLADYTGSDAPQPGARWQQLWRGHGQLPLTVRVVQALGMARDYRYPALYVTLYRRLPDAL